MSKNYISTGCDYITGEKEVKAPQFFCRSCHSCNNNWCNFYNRHVVPRYNRCFNHTAYRPVALSFKAPNNLEEIIAREELKSA